jgi:hypothetical protein
MKQNISIFLLNACNYTKIEPNGISKLVNLPEPELDTYMPGPVTSHTVDMRKWKPSTEMQILLYIIMKFLKL